MRATIGSVSAFAARAISISAGSSGVRAPTRRSTALKSPRFDAEAHPSEVEPYDVFTQHQRYRKHRVRARRHSSRPQECIPNCRRTAHVRVPCPSRTLLHVSLERWRVGSAMTSACGVRPSGCHGAQAPPFLGQPDPRPCRPLRPSANTRSGHTQCPQRRAPRCRSAHTGSSSSP